MSDRAAHPIDARVPCAGEDHEHAAPPAPERAPSVDQALVPTEPIERVRSCVVARRVIALGVLAALVLVMQLVT